MWKNNVGRGRPHLTIWLMHIAYWTPKATNTHSEYITFIAFPPNPRLHERVSMLRSATLLVFFIYGKIPWFIQAFKQFEEGRLTAYPHNHQEVPVRLTLTPSSAQQAKLYQ